jgi:dipeptidyl aminopeptidase/acylaminoacyl peptidase
MPRRSQGDRVRTSLFSGALAFLIAAAPVGAQTPVAAAGTRISAADFAALPVVEKPLLSPDGHQIVARQVKDGITALVVFNADHPDSPGLPIPIGKTEVSSLTWAGNHRLLLTAVVKQHLETQEISVLRLLAIDVPSGESRVLDPKSRGLYAGDVLYADPTGAWALVASQDDVLSYPSVKRVDLATGVATLVEKAKDGVWDWYADDGGILRAGVAYADRRWTVWYRDKPEEKLRAIRGKFDKDDDSAVDKFIFRGDQSWILTNERTGRFALYKYDTKAGAIGAPIFEHPQVDVDDVLYDRATGKVKAVEYEDDRAHLEWLDADLKTLQERIDRALPNAVNVLADWSDDQKRVLVFSYSGSNPGIYFLLDRSTSRMSPVLDPYPRIDPASLAEVTPVSYQARDGVSIPAYLTLPRHHDAKALPLVIMPHGGPFNRDHWEYDPMVQFLANRGYAVFQPEFRGSTGYGKTFVEKGYGEWGRKMQDDLDDGVDWLAKSGRIDPKRVCIVGGSYGGYAAMWGAIRNPGRYRCAASIAGVSDLPSLLRHDRSLFSATRYYREWRSHVGGVGNVDLKTISPLNFASQMKVPLLIAHGEQDERVPVNQSHQMVAALSKAGAPVTSIFYAKDGHGFDNAADLEDWLRRLEAFLAKYNPA